MKSYFCSFVNCPFYLTIISLLQSKIISFVPVKNQNCLIIFILLLPKNRKILISSITVSQKVKFSKLCDPQNQIY